LVAGGTLDAGDDQPDVRDDVVASVRKEIASLVPAAADLAVERAWTCFRPATPDELPVIDRMPDPDNGWVSVGHYRTGLLLASPSTTSTSAPGAAFQGSLASR